MPPHTLDHEDALAERLMRLRRLIDDTGERSRGAARPAEQAAAAGEANHAWHSPLPAHGEPLRLEDLVNGEEAVAAGTSCFVRRSTLGTEHRHGRFALNLALSASPQALTWLAGGDAAGCTSLADALFLDIETTGLSGGPGTLAFLVGAAWFDDGCLEIGQFLMRGPHEEPAVLQLLAEAAGGKRAVVTFNGRAFDVPILETRFVMARRRTPLPTGHVDLLAGARRVWRARLESCRLSHLEQRVLGVQRVDDVPGWLVPHLYFAYLRTGDAQGLAGVLEHNLLDVLSLVTLAGRLGALHQEPSLALEDDPQDLAALGRAFERWPQLGQTEGGVSSGECYELALQHGLAGSSAAQTKLRLALARKRTRQWDAALALWRELADGKDDAVSLAACIELAKHAEHHLKDYAAALGWTERASRLTASCDRSASGIAHRARRLRRRLAAGSTGIDGSQEA